MAQLALAESLTLTVDPRPLFVPSGLLVIPGERYRFAAGGKWQDWFRTVGPTGWKLWPLHLKNRVPGAAFFYLCASIGADDANAFAVGAGLDWTVPDAAANAPDRQLYFFANDWRACYGNNHPLPPEQGGPLTVAITRIA
ncbi:MAG TPA: hypothetical protein VI279_05675 [Rhodocyclaceae bacterium]